MQLNQISLIFKLGNIVEVELDIEDNIVEHVEYDNTEECLVEVDELEVGIEECLGEVDELEIGIEECLEEFDELELGMEEFGNR